MRQYLSCAETAKLVRAALKESFPGVKFAVRSSVYSGGASINIRYTDGPTYEQVKAVAGMFEGSYFDGMTDYKGSNYGALDGQEVRFGADFIFVNRDFSVEILTKAATDVCKNYGFKNEILIDTNECFGAYIKAIGPNADSESRGYMPSQVERIIRENVSQYSMDDTAPSKTLQRVGFLGDDGYGYGAVGRLAA